MTAAVAEQVISAGRIIARPAGPALAGPPAQDLEDFEVYRSGTTVTLRCIQCGKIKNVGSIVLEALVDEAQAHADICRGPVGSW